jgi:hypothetical protein
MAYFFQPCRWKRYVHMKRRSNFNGLHGVIFLKLELFIINTVRIWNPASIISVLYEESINEAIPQIRTTWNVIYSYIKLYSCSELWCIRCYRWFSRFNSYSIILHLWHFISFLTAGLLFYGKKSSLNYVTINSVDCHFPFLLSKTGYNRIPTYPQWDSSASQLQLTTSSLTILKLPWSVLRFICTPLTFPFIEFDAPTSKNLTTQQDTRTSLWHLPSPDFSQQMCLGLKTCTVRWRHVRLCRDSLLQTVRSAISVPVTTLLLSRWMLSISVHIDSVGEKWFIIAPYHSPIHFLRRNYIKL